MLPRQRVPRLRNLVTRSPDLDCILLHLHIHRRRKQGSILSLAFLLFAGGATGEVCLMLAALGVCEVGAIVLVDGETETAFEAADVVFEEVRVFF